MRTCLLEHFLLNSIACNARNGAAVSHVESFALHIGHGASAEYRCVPSSNHQKYRGVGTQDYFGEALECLRTQPAPSIPQRLTLASFGMTWIHSHTCDAV